MNSTTIPGPTAERQLATAFVVELIISCQHIHSYPQSHPAVSASLQKAVAALAPLVVDGEAFTLGVSRQGLLLKNEVLGPGIGKFRKFAALLAAFGIITISFTPELETDDLYKLNRIITRPRNEVWETGGIKHALAALEIQGILVQAIDPSVFNLTEGLNLQENGDPWEIFVRKLLGGYFSISHERMLKLLLAPPAELAREFDAVLTSIPEEAQFLTIKTIADFLGAQERYQGGALSDNTVDKIAAFIAAISPRLRRDLIVNICRSSGAVTGFSDRLLQRFPGDALLDAMHSVASQGENIPEILVKLMRRLSAESETTPALDAAISGADGREKTRSLLREMELEKFVPPDYQKALMTILTTDNLPRAEAEALAGLHKTLERDSQELKISDIIFELAKMIPVAERGEGIRRNLLDSVSFYLAQGDFRKMESICRILGDDASLPTGRAWIDAHLMQDILATATLLGREKQKEIRSLIRGIGQPFVVPLMERLFAEENRSLRRFWFDCLGDLGEMTRNAALERINDERWFVVRNLIIILRPFGDQEVLRHIRRLAGHYHPNVRNEAMKTLFYYRDPMADKILLQELESAEPGRKMAAVQLADLSGKEDVVTKLLAILDGGSVTDYALEIKSAAVNALAAKGSERALPKLKEILFSGSLLHSAKHQKLKTVIIRALNRFPASQARPILEEITAAGKKTLAPLALQSLRTLKETTHDTSAERSGW